MRGQRENSQRYFQVSCSMLQGCCLSLQRTLATDRGFKERVREDMLVRLLDAFVWRNHGQLNSCILFAGPYTFYRYTGCRSAWIHLRTGNECPGGSFPIHYALRDRGLLLLFKIHRRIMSSLCPTYTRRCASRSSG